MNRPSHRKRDPSWAPGPKSWKRRAHIVWPDRTTLSGILKALYPQCKIPLTNEPQKVMVKPEWATLARSRHWIGEDEFHKVPAVWSGKMTTFLIPPLYGLLKKDIPRMVP